MTETQHSTSTPGEQAQWSVGLACLAVLVTGVLGCGTIASSRPGESRDRGRIVVYRDTWGVPHIYAPTVEDGLYAQGWAQAEDRPEQLLRNYLMAMGEYSTVVGEEGVQGDLQARLFDHYGKSKRAWDSLDAPLKGQLRAYVGGINGYYRGHSQDVPAWWGDREIDPVMVLAFERFFLDWWTIHEAYGDLERGGITRGFEPDLRGSNQFAVAPRRSAEGAAILAIDPHLRFDGQYRTWEFRVHAGTWEGSGVGLPGLPFILLGHNRHLAWAMTTGGPDTADIYELSLHPAPGGGPGGPRYLYDGEWRELTARRIALEVRGAPTQQHTLWYSHHGPVIARHGDKAWAARTAYDEAPPAIPAFRELNFARDYTGAVRAMESLLLFPQNVMVADSSGNIYYQRTGRVPRRSTGLDCSKPLDGSTSATEWLGFHPASDHLQVLNPAQGYMQNCNDPPDAMMPGSPFRLVGTLDYLFGDLVWGPSRAGWVGQRGARAIELLSEDDRVTAEEAIAYVSDVKVSGAGRWLEALRAADQQFGAEFASHAFYRTGIEDLLSWDRHNTEDSTGALKYEAWRGQLVSDHGAAAARALASAVDDHFAIVEGRKLRSLELSAEHRRMLVASLAAAMDAVVKRFGSLDATFGARHQIVRGERSWPVAGSGEAPGTGTLRALWYVGPAAETGNPRATPVVGGQGSTQVVVMSNPPRSWIASPLGQSDREGSPHFDDQARRLFSARQLKPSWWLPEDLAPHVESRTELPRGAR